jgi:hypothetical protein
VHPRNRRCLSPGQNPFKGEPKPPVFPRIRAKKKHSHGRKATTSFFHRLIAEATPPTFPDMLQLMYDTHTSHGNWRPPADQARPKESHRTAFRSIHQPHSASPSNTKPLINSHNHCTHTNQLASVPVSQRRDTRKVSAAPLLPLPPLFAAAACCRASTASGQPCCCWVDRSCSSSCEEARVLRGRRAWGASASVTTKDAVLRCSLARCAGRTRKYSSWSCAVTGWHLSEGQRLWCQTLRGAMPSCPQGNPKAKATTSFGTSPKAFMLLLQLLLPLHAAGKTGRRLRA